MNINITVQKGKHSMWLVGLAQDIRVGSISLRLCTIVVGTSGNFFKAQNFSNYLNCSNTFQTRKKMHNML